MVGGQSLEHEISLLSGAYVSSQLDHKLYNVVHFAIDKQGRWSFWDDHYPEIEDVNHCKSDKVIPNKVLEALCSCDIAYPVLHGPYGEDGTIQGFFEMIGIPYVGCDHRASAVCMDKAMTKELCQGAGVLTSPYVAFSAEEWKTKRDSLLGNIVETFSFPLYVKAAHLGSSIGVYRVDSVSALTKAVDDVFRVDTKALVEEEVKGRELEFALLGLSNVISSAPGEVLSNGKTYDYHAKYGTNSFKTVAKAEGLSKEQVEELKSLAIRCFKAAGCQGLARIDFFLDNKGSLWLNEINPIPGFTPISLYPKMCEESGLKISSVIDKLITIGFYRRRQKVRVS